MQYRIRFQITFGILTPVSRNEFHKVRDRKWERERERESEKLQNIKDERETGQEIRCATRNKTISLPGFTRICHSALLEEQQSL